MQIVHKEAYSATTTDLSAMVSKLRRAQPDVILHTGYNPDITLFLRQAKEGRPEVLRADRAWRRATARSTSSTRPSRTT
jgi:ABC-type branched-subunit amino acid transport system substrate-binding protein